MTRADRRKRAHGSGAVLHANEKILVALETFTGLTAMAGGILLMARPDGSLLQMAPAALASLARNSPFPDFFLPGMALAGVVGGGMLGASTLLMRRRCYADEVAMAAGAALVLFEIIECAAIGFMPLQGFEGGVGLLVLGLAARHWSAAAHPLRHALP